MKMHITPKQAKEVTEKEFYSFFNEVVHRKDWANYHHRKMTIGKMIDYLDEVLISKNAFSGRWQVDDRYFGNELVDALWEAIKDTLK